MPTENTSSNHSSETQITISSKCGSGACIGIERDDTGAMRVVNVKNGVTTTGFVVTDDELRAFISGAAEGDFNHLLRKPSDNQA